MRYTLDGVTPALNGGGQFIAPSADVIGDVELGADASVWYQCVIRGDQDKITIGAGSNIQDASVLHTDRGMPLDIGERVTCGHKVMLHGCHIGDESLIGIGAIVLNGAHIGRHCLVGAGSLITEGKTFEPGQLIMGSPARVIRDLTADEIALIQASAAHYVANAQRFLAGTALAD